MRAIDFYKAFKANTKEDTTVEGKTLFDIYKKDAEFTPVVTKIIEKIIQEAGYTSQREYFRIDVVGWVSRYKDMEADARDKKLKVDAHVWDLKIAVEHENSKSDWSDEVMKLIHVKCPLKVIIGYSYSNERGEIERKKLDFVAKWMQEIDALNKGTDEQYLIILGNGCNRKGWASDYTEFGYVGYLYNWDEKRFERIGDE